MPLSAPNLQKDHTSKHKHKTSKPHTYKHKAKANKDKDTKSSNPPARADRPLFAIELLPLPHHNFSAIPALATISTLSMYAKYCIVPAGLIILPAPTFTLLRMAVVKLSQRWPGYHKPLNDREIQDLDLPPFPHRSPGIQVRPHPRHLDLVAAS